MSEFENKAKTIQEAEREFNIKIDSYSGSSEMRSAQKEFDKQKWVPLEDTRKLEKWAHDEFDANKKKSKQIEEANKIIKAFPDSRTFEGNGVNSFNISEYLHQIAIWYCKLKKTFVGENK